MPTRCRATTISPPPRGRSFRSRENPQRERRRGLKPAQIIGKRGSLADNRKMDATTFPVECRHCGNKGTMLILAQARETEEFEDDSNPMFPLQWEAGNIYQTLRCYSCNLVTFYQ